jgi:hypothetical protein
MTERLQHPDAPEIDEDEAPEEQYACPYCPMVFAGPDAGYELGGHELEHIEEAS